jgi:hypothetical protein
MLLHKQLKHFWDRMDDSKYNIPFDLQLEISNAFKFAVLTDYHENDLNPSIQCTTNPTNEHAIDNEDEIDDENETDLENEIDAISLSDFLSGPSVEIKKEAEAKVDNGLINNNNLIKPLSTNIDEQIHDNDKDMDMDFITFMLSNNSNINKELPNKDNLNVKTTLEPVLTTWEFNTDGTRKNIRTLIASLHTIWPNNNWKPVSLINLISNQDIKKVYRRIMILSHPDKISSTAPDNIKIIAERVFSVINTAFKTLEQV